jgi:hypothetical protein
MPIFSFIRYQRYWEQAMQSGAAGISITSFNEWGEGTQIEAAQAWKDPDSLHPFQDYGAEGPQLYMKLTGEYADKFKAHTRKQQEQHTLQQEPHQDEEMSNSRASKVGTDLGAETGVTDLSCREDLETASETACLNQQEL